MIRRSSSPCATRREAAPNAVDHPGEDVARQQREAYSDLVPVRLAGEPAAVFAAAEEVARDMVWEVLAADRAAGRIEAVAGPYGSASATTW